MNAEQIEAKLWDLIDGTLPADEVSFVENLVKTNQEWKEKHAELLQIHSMMHDSFELDEPSMSFTRNVMEEIGRLNVTPATRKYLDARIIRSIGGFFVLSIIALIIFAFTKATFSTTGQGTVLAEKLDSVNYNQFASSTYMNIFLMINTVLGLVLLDFYLGSKKKKLSDQQ
ncbi:MAG: hypothetical protein EOO02_16255 [Chitinophagaceae bacterium]|jgi:hypothetical protein|nr:MAG: hypothetical protein EOO02_16255 [Chitinophagaceae bacterium]